MRKVEIYLGGLKIGYGEDRDLAVAKNKAIADVASVLFRAKSEWKFVEA